MSVRASNATTRHFPYERTFPAAYHLKMGADKKAVITVVAPITRSARLRALLKEHPRLQHACRGLVFRKFIVTGDPKDIAEFRARLSDWEYGCLSVHRT